MKEWARKKNYVNYEDQKIDGFKKKVTHAKRLF